MRVAFAGSPDPAVPVLNALAESEHEIALVISQPDRRRGRRGSARPTAVAARALELGLPVLRPDSINSDEALARLREADVGAIAVAAFGQLLRGGRFTGTYSYEDVIKLALGAKGDDEFGYRAEFINLVRMAEMAAALKAQNP